MKKKINLVKVLFFCTTLVCAQEPQVFTGETIPCETPESMRCKILGSKLEGEHVIRNNVEYQVLIEDLSPHPNCVTYQLPPIDFTKHSLIGYISSIGGCGFPTVTHQINKLNENYVVDITITQQGLCKRNNPIQLGCLVPRIPAHAQVNFEIETIINR
ncbi:hypothetical protein N9V23_01295 [Flavobacteriales bacterium]|nr:hypothetical protein [Flavobacteriales bacterium]